MLRRVFTYKCNMDEYSGMDEASGEEEVLFNQTVSETANQVVANGLGWGLGMFVGIVLVVSVTYFALRRKRRYVNF